MKQDGISEIRSLFKNAPAEALPGYITRFSDDPRAGVQQIVRLAGRRLDAENAERDRLRAMMALQAHLHDDGHILIAGVDEVGRGALAGPVSASAVILPLDAHIPGLDDSKRLSATSRESISLLVKRCATAFVVAHIGPSRIDALGIAAANTLAMRTALDGLGSAVDHVIADGRAVDLGCPATFVVGGDRQCACVAAASIVAKVERDTLMREMDMQYPGYGFAINNGYGTAEHLEAIESLGPSPIHRLSFAPCGQHRLF